MGTNNSLNRSLRRKETKRKADWNNKFSQLGVQLATEIIGTDGNWETEEVQAIVNKWDYAWRVYVRKEFSKYTYLAQDKVEREKYLNSFKEFSQTICTRRVNTLNSKAKPIVNKVSIFGKDITLEEYQKAFKEIGVMTTAKTLAGLNRVKGKLDKHQHGNLKRAILKLAKATGK